MYIVILFCICISFFYINRYDYFNMVKIIKIREVFRNNRDQQKGLMYRKKLDPGVGYMFYYNPEKPAYFWMKNTAIPLDIIFIDKHKKIVHMIQNMKPHDTTSKGYPKKIKYAIEVKAGYIKRNGLIKGMQVRFNYV